MALMLPGARHHLAAGHIEHDFGGNEEIPLAEAVGGSLAPEDAEMIFQEIMEGDIRAASASSHGEAADRGASEQRETKRRKVDSGLGEGASATSGDDDEDFEEWRERTWRERHSHAVSSDHDDAPPPLDLSDLPTLLQYHDWPVRPANPAIPEQNPRVHEDGIERWAPIIEQMDADDPHAGAVAGSAATAADLAALAQGVAIEIAPELLREIADIDECLGYEYFDDDADDDDDSEWFGELLLSAAHADVSTADTANADESTVPAESALLVDDDDDGRVAYTPPLSFSRLAHSPTLPMPEGYTSTRTFDPSTPPTPTRVSFATGAANFFSAPGSAGAYTSSAGVASSAGL